jgi:hypothetical protein
MFGPKREEVTGEWWKLIIYTDQVLLGLSNQGS